LALFLRILDDNHGFSKREWKHIEDCGTLILKDGTLKELPPREIANKIIHSKKYEWKEATETIGLGPLLTCYGRDNEKWLRAEIEIFALAAICGQLMS
jgi:hypothetical protein